MNIHKRLVLLSVSRDSNNQVVWRGELEKLLPEDFYLHHISIIHKRHYGVLYPLRKPHCNLEKSLSK